MSKSSDKTIGDVRVVVSNHGLAEGWNIDVISVSNRPIIWKKGQFETEQEAIDAALKIAESQR